MSTVEQRDGLWVGTLGSEPEQILQRVRQALSLIKTHDRQRYDRLIHDLKRVWVVALNYPIACFDARLGACMLNDGYVLAKTTTPELLASTIVHEATHARLWRRGIRYEEESRSRVEAACIRRELAFSTKLPDGRDVRKNAERSLAFSCNQNTLSNVALAKLRNGQTVQNLHRLGIPDWGVLLLKISARTVGVIVHPIRWGRYVTRLTIQQLRQRATRP